MDHQVAMSEGDRVAGDQQQAEAILDRERALLREEVDGHAVDPLHHQVGTAVGQRSAVDHASDGRVLEPRENAALAPEAIEQVLGVEAAAHDLDRDLLLEGAVVALAGIDVGHAAAAEEPDDAKRSRALRRALRRRRRLGGRRQAERLIEELV